MGQGRIMVATGNITRGRFVVIDPANSNHVKQAGLNDNVIGIADVASDQPPLSNFVTQNPPYAAQDGENVRVHQLGASDILLEAGSGGYSPGDQLQSDANGAGITVALVAGKGRIGAVAESAALQGEMGMVQVHKYEISGAAS